MKLQRSLYVAGLVLLVIAGGSWLTRGDAASRQQWEYKTVYGDWPDDLKPSLNALGAEGWELIAVDRDVQNGGTDSRRMYFFKRLR